MTDKNVYKYYNCGYCKHKERCRFDNNLSDCIRKCSENIAKKAPQMSVKMERTVSLWKGVNSNT